MSEQRIIGQAEADDSYFDDESGADDDADYGYYNRHNYAEEPDYDPEPTGLFGTPARAIILIGTALMLFLITGLAAWLLGQSGSPISASSFAATNTANIDGLDTAVRVGALPPDFTLNEIYTGKPITLSSMRGKPVWVNFWATWCPPCRAEMPEMKQRYAKYKDKGLVILGVDDREDNASVKQFVELGGYDWTFVIDGDSSVMQRYIVTGIPTHIFVDKAGVIRAITVGGISGGIMDDSLAKIVDQ